MSKVFRVGGSAILLILLFGGVIIALASQPQGNGHLTTSTTTLTSTVLTTSTNILTSTTTTTIADPVQPCSYIIFKPNATFYEAENCSSQQIDFKGANASQIIQSAENAGGGLIHVRPGSYSISGTITLQFTTILEGEGGLTTFLVARNIVALNIQAPVTIQDIQVSPSVSGQGIGVLFGSAGISGGDTVQRMAFNNLRIGVDIYPNNTGIAYVKVESNRFSSDAIGVLIQSGGTGAFANGNRILDNNFRVCSTSCIILGLGVVNANWADENYFDGAPSGSTCIVSFQNGNDYFYENTFDASNAATYDLCLNSAANGSNIIALNFFQATGRVNGNAGGTFYANTNL